MDQHPELFVPNDLGYNGQQEILSIDRPQDHGGQFRSQTGTSKTKVSRTVEWNYISPSSTSIVVDEAGHQFAASLTVQVSHDGWHISKLPGAPLTGQLANYHKFTASFSLKRSDYRGTSAPQIYHLLSRVNNSQLPIDHFALQIGIASSDGARWGAPHLTGFTTLRDPKKATQLIPAFRLRPNNESACPSRHVHEAILQRCADGQMRYGMGDGSACVLELPRLLISRATKGNKPAAKRQEMLAYTVRLLAVMAGSGPDVALVAERKSAPFAMFARSPGYLEKSVAKAATAAGRKRRRSQIDGQDLRGIGEGKGQGPPARGYERQVEPLIPNFDPRCSSPHGPRLATPSPSAATITHLSPTILPRKHDYQIDGCWEDGRADYQLATIVYPAAPSHLPIPGRPVLTHQPLPLELLPCHSSTARLRAVDGPSGTPRLSRHRERPLPSELCGSRDFAAWGRGG